MSDLPRWMDKTASVFLEADDFAAAVKSDLACALIHYTIDGSTAGSDRAELMAARLLLWDPAYEMPEGSQVEIDGVRWQTARGGFALLKRRLIDNSPAYRRAHVLRAV